MKSVCCLVFALGLGLSGCSKREASAAARSTNAPSTNNASASGNPLTAPVDYLGAVGRAKRVAEKTVDLASLNRSIQLFEAQEDRFPKDLNELVSMHYLPALPALPPGFRFAYNPANGQVRVVPR